MRQFPIALLALIAALFASCSSNDCKIQGTIEGGNDGDTLLLITDQENGIPFDTIFVKDGKFEYELALDSTTLCFVQTQKGNNILPFFLEPGNITITIKDDPALSTISGTHLNEEWQALNSAASQYQKEMTQMMEAAQDTTQATQEALKAKAMETTQKLSAKFYQTAEKNIDNELGYLLVTNPAMLTEDQVLTLINKMPKKMRSRKQIQEIEQYLKYMGNGPSADGNTKIEDFSAPTPEGKTVSAMSVVGANELTIIDFWASWCGPCMKEMPHMVEIYNLYKDKGLGILGVSLDTDKEAWTAAIKQTGATWTHISELNRNSKIAQQFGVNAIPFTLVVDREGNVLASGLTGNDLEDFVRDNLKK